MNDFSPAQAALEKIVELHGKRRAPKEIHVPNFMLNGCFDDNQRLVPNLASALCALRAAPEISECVALDEMLHAPVLTLLQEWPQKHAELAKIGKDTRVAGTPSRVAARRK
jgi:hypothetical protein